MVNGRVHTQKITDSSKEKLLIQLENEHIPIIAMTANVLEKDRQLCKKAGMDHFLSKPFMPENLYNAINALQLPINNSHAPAVTAKTESNNRNATFQEHTINHLRQTYRLSDKNIDKILHNAVRDINSDLKDLADALHNKDLKQIQKTAHRLKGVLLNLGLQSFADQALEIESPPSSPPSMLLT